MTDKTGKKQRRPSGKPWKPGESGNPKGRPPGLGEVAKLRAAIAEKIPGILAKLVELAELGDVQAARALLDRSMPMLRAESVPVAVAGLDTGSLTERGSAALTAVGRGEVAPDIGAQIISALAGLVRVKEVEELEMRIAALEIKNEVKP